MGIYFSDQVEILFKEIFQCWDQHRIQEAQKKLKLLADGIHPDADACVLLSRTYAGKQFVWSGAHLPEDDGLCYSYLHKGIKLGSALGILQALRMEGGLPPAILQNLPMSLEKAYQLVREAANKGDAFCQYILGNVYYWNDHLRIGGAAIEDLQRNQIGPKKKLKIVNYFFKRFYNSTRKSVFGSHRNYQKIADVSIEVQNMAIYWLEKSIAGGFILFPGNLRNLYLAQKKYEQAKLLAEKMAKLGNPEMMYWYAVSIEKDNNDLLAAIPWYEKGASLQEPCCFEELGDIYFWHKLEKLRNVPPYKDHPILREYESNIDFSKKIGVTYYEKGGKLGNTYCMIQCVYAYSLAIGRSQDWGRAAWWADRVSKIILDTQNTDLLPFLGIMLLLGLGIYENKELGVGLLKAAEKEASRRRKIKIFEYLPEVQKLWQNGLKYAVQENLLSPNELLNEENWLQSNLDVHNIIFRKKWPQDFLVLSVQGKDGETLYRTSNYTLKDWLTSVENYGMLWLFMSKSFIVGDYFSDLLTISVVKNKEKNLYKVFFHGSIDSKGYPVELRYVKTMSLKNVKLMLLNLYQEQMIPDLEKWEIQYLDMDEPDASYILEVDKEEFNLDDYKNSSANIWDGLKGIKNNFYQTLFVYLRNLTTGGFFVYKNKEGKEDKEDFLIHVLVPRFNENYEEKYWQLYQYKMSNIIELHLWLLNFVVDHQFPNVDNWEELPLPEDNSYTPLY